MLKFQYTFKHISRFFTYFQNLFKHCFGYFQYFVLLSMLLVSNLNFCGHVLVIWLECYES